jgi:glycerate 2-kinase
MRLEPRRFLRELFDAAVAAAAPERCLAKHLPPPPPGRTIVVGAGKASASMASTFERHWRGDLSGLVVTRYGHAAPTQRIEVVQASHPVPDAAGVAAAGRMLGMVEHLSRDDLVVCLISGGASSLLTLPSGGLTLDDKQAINRALLRSGATIAEMNCVRKHLSTIKGGRLAAACTPAQVLTLVISDVPGDDPSVIGSGPTVPDPTTRADALGVLDRYGIHEPRAAIDHLRDANDETPKPGDGAFARTRQVTVATPQMSLEAAAEYAHRVGVTPVILGDALEGEAREMARVLAGIARQVRLHSQPASAPCVLLSGGESTVTVRGSGRGGRNAEFLLSLAIALGGDPHIHAIACDTDGIDGTEDNAGALLGPDSLARASALGLNPPNLLADNDGYRFFAALEDLVVTGPTLTNVNDFRAILVR